MEDGFVRIAHELHQAISRSRMTGRERSIVDAVIRFTYGWQRKEARITGETFAEWTGLDASDCNSVVTELVRRKILFRAGSRSPISLNKDYSQWEKPRGASRRVKRKADSRGDKHPTRGEEIKTPDSGDKHPTEPGDKHPTYIDRKDNPSSLRSEGGEISGEEKPKDQGGKAVTNSKPAKLDLSNLPDGISVDTAQAFIDHRKVLKKPLTQRALNLSLAEAVKASQAIPDMTPDQAIDEAILAGWQGVKAQWLVNRIGAKGSIPSRPDGRKGFVQPKPHGSYTPTDMDNLPAWMRD